MVDRRLHFGFFTMAKDPAFLFYSQDFYTGVATLNWEDRGKYISLLCLMHQQGRMNEETIRFLVGSISDNLKSKFNIDENGLWYNKRLELEAEKRSKYTESRRNIGVLGGRPKKTSKKEENLMDNHKDNLKVNHMGNLTEDENDNENKNVKKKLNTVNYTEKFSKLWKVYNKGSKFSAFKQWKLLGLENDDEVLDKISTHVIGYMQRTEKTYRKDLERYLSSRLWEQ